MTSLETLTVAQSDRPVSTHPEFDAPVLLPIRPRDVAQPPEQALRLVGNPFLALFGLIAWVGAMYAILFHCRPESGVGAILVLLLGGPVLLPLLLHYHCLDCGATGRLAHWRNHRCERSDARLAAGVRRRLRGPSPTVQAVLWVCALLALILWLTSSGWLPYRPSPREQAALGICVLLALGLGLCLWGLLPDMR